MLVVQKYGGTSVGTLERIQAVANRVKKRADEGNDMIVVVSAMSGETNKLIEYAEYFGKKPDERELDMLLSSGERVTSSLLAIALKQMGKKSISLSGGQAGILTDNSHSKARIKFIDNKKVQSKIKEGYIVIVAGFQGVNEFGDITTLGRGGSDLTAVALAGALKADICEIYTDVNGVYTSDPRIVKKAKKLDVISYDEMLELASMGAKVLQTRSVEMAKKLNVNLVTRSSFNESEGTLITKEENIMEKPIVSGIVIDRNQARVTLRSIVDKPGIAAEIFRVLANKNINVDMIIQNVGLDGTTNLGFTVPENEFALVKETLDSLQLAKLIQYDDEIAKVSIVGVGMKSNSGVACTAFEALAKENINIEMISTSEIKISIVVDQKYGELAVRALHKAYELDDEELS